MPGFPPVTSAPFAPERNPPIEPQDYQPSQFNITAISYGLTTTVTTAVSPYGVKNNYVIGQLVRILIPAQCGAFELNNQEGYVIAIPGTNQVTINLNSSKASPFNASGSKTPPQIVAVGDTNSGPTNTGRLNQTTYIQGSFINISPVLSG